MTRWLSPCAESCRRRGPPPPCLITSKLMLEHSVEKNFEKEITHVTALKTLKSVQLGFPFLLYELYCYYNAII